MVRIELKTPADADALAARCAAAAPQAALPSHARARILAATADVLEGEAELFARLIVEEVKKPLKEARREAARAAFTFRWAAEEARRIGGEVLPLDLDANSEGRYAMVKRVPRGPALFITPFNFPLNLVAHKVAPAVAAGLPFILKPDPRGPKTAERLIEALVGAGWPAEAALVAHGDIPVVEALVRDDRLRVLSFTGSTKAGWHLKSISGKKHCVLELGGNAGVFVGADADLAWAAARCAWGAYAYSGQTCISVQRIVVEKPAYAEFRKLLVQKISELKTGNQNDENTDIGPLIDEAAAVRVEDWIGEAVARGAKILAGGRRSGPFLPPTLLENAPPDCRLSCEEAFGPVATLEAFDLRERALDRLAEGRYGLQAGIFSNDLAFVHRVFDRLSVGGLIVNDVPTYRADAAPYGGTRDSGLGREGVRWAIEEYTERKTLVMKP
jgi:acyl-CoA reductase-like NAD-dependent aldehyde dehydrogenase